MNIDYTVNKEGFDKLDETTQALYKKSGEDYQLNVKGVVSKSKLDEFRENNHTMENELKDLQNKYKNVDLDKYAEYTATQQKLEDKKLIDAGEIDTLVAAKIAVVQSDFEAKLNHANNEITKLTEKNQTIVSKYEIQGATAKAFTDNKIRPEMHAPLTSQINSMFKVKEGKVIAMEGEKILTGENGNLTIGEFVSTQPDIMKVPSNGGQGSGGGQGPTGQQRTSVDKIRAGLSK